MALKKGAKAENRELETQQRGQRGKMGQISKGPKKKKAYIKGFKMIG